jgi:hypothetical protein
MARATFHKAADGYPARDAASWTEEKLMILDAYLNSFAKACRTAAPDHPELVTRIYGHDGWKDIYARRESGEISAEDARGEYVRMYAEGFKRLGYATVLDRQIKKSNGQPMYFLIFATDNDAGERIMDWVFDRVRLRVEEELGQTTLFDMESGPRKRRLNGGDS